MAKAKIHKQKTVAVADLIPYANNARTHSDEQVAQIAGSITEFGFTNPVIIDEKNNLIAGHGRLMAANKLEVSEVPAIVVEGLTEAQKKLLIIADNKLALNAGWDFELLAFELEDLKGMGADIELTGFSAKELDEILKPVETELPELDSGEKDPFQQRTFIVHDEQWEIIESALAKAKTHPETDTGLNENINGNAITYICERWLAANG